MNFILYITFYTFLLQTISSENEKDEYDILPYTLFKPEQYDIIDGTGSFLAFKFIKSNPIVLAISDVALNDTTLSAPFMLYTAIRMDIPSCLFSIIDKSTTKLSLCFTDIGADLTRITLTVNEKDVTEFELNADKFEDWTKLLLQVNSDNIKLMINCEDVDPDDGIKILEEELEDILISGDAILNLGHNSQANFFEGGVEKLIIYTNKDDKPKLVMNCEPIFGPSTYGEAEKVPTAEKLTLTNAEKGEKGDKGDKGDSIPGSPGPEGPPGSPGRKGDTGTCSCSESIVSSLLKKMPEMRGPPGEKGQRGEIGEKGVPGKTGKQGDKGDRGSEGLKGETGEKGYNGNPGEDGKEGLKGEPGRTGDSGPPGSIGSPGPPGPPGEAHKETAGTKEIPVPGAKGDMGPEGPIGPRGDRGEKGEKGQQGVKGEKGDTGHNGPQGPRGERGEKGEPGTDGSPGEPGTHGTPADKGDKGERGDKGAPGLPGLPATIYSLLDPEMDPEKNAEVVEKLRGYKGDTGSKGEQGIKGDTGPIGPPGLHGEDGVRGAHGAKGPQGDMGLRGYKGEPGEPGPPGNVSLSEFTLMKGPKGDKGDIGPSGKDGNEGPRGYTGKEGAPGPSGLKGIKGGVGPMGSEGSQGPRGLTGSKGEKGESVLTTIDTAKLKGDKGDRGDDGKPGKDGQPGLSGKCSESCKAHVVQGPPGPPGPPGSSVIGPKGEPGGVISENTFYKITGDENRGSLLDDDDYYYPMNVVFRTVTALLKHTTSTPLGTLAYVLREKTLLLRVENGWQYVVMGSLLQTRPTTTHKPTAAYRPPPIHLNDEPPNKRSPSERSQIRLIALNEAYPGNMLYFDNKTGRAAANTACLEQSRLYRVGGNFVAFLADRVEDLRNLVKIESDRSLPVVNKFDQVLFKSWQGMFDGSGASIAANIYSFHGKNIFNDQSWPTHAVWHGGNIYGTRQPEAYCEEWKTSNRTTYGLASNLARNKLLEQHKYPCDSKLIVLCVEATASPKKTRHASARRTRAHSRRTYNSNRL